MSDPLRDSAAETAKESLSAQELWQQWRDGQGPALQEILVRAGELAPDQLLAALQADQRERWLRGERVLVEAYLGQYPYLLSNHGHALDLIFREVFLREDLGELAQLQEYLNRFPQYEDQLKRQFAVHDAVRFVLEQESQESAGTVAWEGERPADMPRTKDASSSAETVDPEAKGPESPGASVMNRPLVGDYEVLSELGHGGMGVVYKARQRSLNRIVALKMIKAGAHASPHQRARFTIEAEAVASLQHPNIVQIYEVGEISQCPFFSLEFMDGGSLEAKINDQPQPPRDAAELVEKLARAMHLAHLRGIVHRDLKPANVLLTSDGVPKITDFGLAKRLEEDSRTQTGVIVGTPNYMAPEQASGKNREVTPLADVYSLGAILYEMLTGQPPFESGTAMATVLAVQFNEPLAPSKLQARLPRDLETICLKCLEKEPHKRYASAEALAEDLRRFLNDEPIQARPVSLRERTVKWAKRHPALAALVGVSVLAAVLLVGLVIWLILASQAAARRDRLLAEEAERERVRAQKRSQQARQAADDMYTQVVADWLADDPQKDAQQREFLQKALKLYEEFAAEEDSSDPELRRLTARAHFQVGEVHRALGQTAEAEKAYLQTIQLQQHLSDEFPDQPLYRQDLARSHNWLGELFREGGQRLPEAEQHFRAALLLQEQLVGQFPDRPDYRSEKARSHYNLGIVERATARRSQARADYDLAILLLDQLQEQFPDKREYRHELARSCINRGVLLRDLGENPKAKRDGERAIELLQELHKQARYKPVYRSELAIAHSNLGNLLWSNKEYADAAKANDQALTLLRELVDEYPTRPLYRKKLANTHNSWGAVLATANDPPDLTGAEKAWLQSLALWQGLIDQEKEGKVADYQAGKGQVLGNLGWLYYQRQDYAKARAQLEQGIGLLQTALKTNPNNPDYLQTLFNQYDDLAKTQIVQGDHAAAVKTALALPQVYGKRGPDSFAAACHIARCIPLVEKDGKVSEIERKSLAEGYADQALRQLHEAVGKGYRDGDALKKEPALEPLRERRRKDFDKVVAEVEVQSKSDM